MGASGSRATSPSSTPFSRSWAWRRPVFRQVVLNGSAYQALEAKRVAYTIMFGGVDDITAELGGAKLRLFPIRDYLGAAASFPDDSLVASDREIASNASVLRRGLAALAQGYIFSARHPAQAEQILIEDNRSFLATSQQRRGGHRQRHVSHLSDAIGAVGHVVRRQLQWDHSDHGPGRPVRREAATAGLGRLHGQPPAPGMTTCLRARHRLVGPVRPPRGRAAVASVPMPELGPARLRPSPRSSGERATPGRAGGLLGDADGGDRPCPAPACARAPGLQRRDGPRPDVGPGHVGVWDSARHHPPTVGPTTRPGGAPFRGWACRAGCCVALTARPSGWSSTVPPVPNGTWWYWRACWGPRSSSATRRGLSVSSGSFGVLRWEGLQWHHEPPVASWVAAVIDDEVAGDRRVLEAMLEFAVHDLGSNGIGSLLIYRPRTRAGPPVEERLPVPPPLQIRRAAHLAPLRHALGQVDGAAIFDAQGVLRRLGVRLVPSPAAEEDVEAFGGTRHTSGRRYSRDDPLATVIAVSEDGPVSVLRDGKVLGPSRPASLVPGRALEAMEARRDVDSVLLAGLLGARSRERPRWSKPGPRSTPPRPGRRAAN